MTRILRDDGVQHVELAAPGEAYVRMVADALVADVQRVLAQRGSYSLALTGGRSPRPVYEYLAGPCRSRIDWSRVAIFWGDERTVPPDDEESNFGMARDCLLSALPVPPAHVYRMEAERADLDAAAADYEQQIRKTLRAAGPAIPVFDLILLGMGDDGHTASLFPGTSALQERQRLVVANDVPQLQTRRMTFTFPLINAAQAVWFLVTGTAKAARLAEVLNPRGAVRYPCQGVQLVDRPVHWYLDDAAGAEIAPVP